MIIDQDNMTTDDTSDEAPDLRQDATFGAESVEASPVELSQPESDSKSKGGAPVGNVNALKHGLRGSKMPRSARYVENALASFRNAILDELASIRDTKDLSVADSATVNRAIRCETRARLALHWLRSEDDKLSMDDRLRLLDVVSAATESRDKALSQLGIVPTGKPVGQVDQWAEFDRERKAQP
jgi:hypothetical protein